MVGYTRLHFICDSCLNEEYFFRDLAVKVVDFLDEMAEGWVVSCKECSSDKPLRLHKIEVIQ